MLPPEVMQHYVLDRDSDEEQQIINYMNGQAPDEIVKMVERIKTEYVLSEKYEIWDVTTDQDSWWVITNLTNLYPKKYMPSADLALSLHIGLMARIRHRDAAPATEFEPFEEIYRRGEQAKDMWDRAVEPEEFQAVGMVLRENLLSLIAALRKLVDLRPDVVRPKGSDFKEWSVVVLDHLCPGDRNKELRTFMKAMADRTWGLVNWATHDRDANKSASNIAAHTVDTLTGHFIQLLYRHQTDQTDQCPRCSSRNIRSHYDREIQPGGAYYQTCGKCDWSNHPGYGDDEEGEWRQSSA
jgi:hypothetical protein